MSPTRTPPHTGGGFKAVCHRLWHDHAARWAVAVLLFLYAAVALADVIAPVGPYWRDRSTANAPPTAVYVRDAQGRFHWPFVLKQTRVFHEESLEYLYPVDPTVRYSLKLGIKGEPYALLGLFQSDCHLVNVDAPASLHLLGTDMNGRDIFSRLLFGGRISLTIGFLSLLVAFPIGLIYGGIAGFAGGWVDSLMMRFAEILMSIPSLYLLLTLATIIPASLSSTERFALVVISLALIGWAGLSRVVRGLVLSIKQQEFVEASRALGQRPWVILTRHILPQTWSFVVVAVTLSVPGYLLMESGLSFLGLGIQQPDASWGNLLKEAQTLTNVLYRPWMLAPGLLIFAAVLAFNILGDTVRDVLDPKSQART
ncbi:MAG: ABC transporter permease [Vampirovibrionales bacterium]|nr:ABC transporter permease [Vampirovibrionales bacterium]